MRDPERRYQPTRRRRQEARRRGQVTRSTELNSVLILLVVLLLMTFMGSSIYRGLSIILRDAFIRVAQASHMSNLPDVAGLAWEGSKLILPIMLVAFVVAILSNVLQIGIVFTAYPLQPRFDKINPVSGFQRIFSVRSLFELGKSLGKIAIISGVSYLVIRGRLERLAFAMDMAHGEFLRFIAHTVARLFLWTCVTLIALALMDYFYQRREHERGLLMTFRELLDDLRQEEGDPHVRARIRSLRQSITRQRMMAQVEEADVVIINPVHLAVALKYDTESMQAPCVAAKGARKLADTIREIAQKHRIPIVENPPLAQILYKTVEVDQEVPERLYEAIVEVFVYIHRLAQRRHSTLAAMNG